MLLRFLGVLPLLLASQLQAQLTTFFIPDVEAAPDQFVELDLSVEDFRAVAAAQLSLNWDPEQLSFQEVKNLALGATATANFNLRQTDAGRLAYTFMDPALQGYDLEDGTILYSLRFKVLARVGEEVHLNFSEQPTRCLVGNGVGQEMPAQFTGATIRVMPDLTGTPAEVQMTALPNPFSVATQLRIEMIKEQTAQLRIYDLQGRLVQQRSLELDAGVNQVSLEASDMPAAGTYLIEVTGDELQLSQKVVFTGG